MRTKQLIAGVGVGLMAMVGQVGAHHAFSSEFDVKKPLTLKGIIVKWEMINPHSWFHLEVKDHPDRHRGDDRGLCGQGRDEQGRRQELHPGEWEAALRRIAGEPRRAAGPCGGAAPEVDRAGVAAGFSRPLTSA